ncbi:MAG: hypothetical protein MJY56_08095 [Bacteroidales bacterium]|nr:hypothetical protein [Bacteroidales bacterium]
MKKIIIAALAIASLLACTTPDNPKNPKKTEFGKLVVTFEVTSADGKGEASPVIFDYLDFKILGHDFGGQELNMTGCFKDGSAKTIECTTAPTADRSQFASVIFTTSILKEITDPINVDFAIAVSGVIYDSKGNVIDGSRSKIYSNKFTGQMSNATLVKEFQYALIAKQFELCYVQNALSGEWMYNLAVSPLPEG